MAAGHARSVVSAAAAMLLALTPGTLQPSADRLFQDDRLVGQITFMRGWSKAPAFFRTSSTAAKHSIRAVGVLLRSNRTVVPGSTERSPVQRWRVKVQPGQIVP